MGTTSEYVNFKKSSRAELKRFLEDINNQENDKVSNKVIYQSVRSNVAYQAVEIITKLDNTRKVVACIIKFGFKGNEIFYKTMDESMHPYYYEAPLKLITLLTPTENEHALEWRDKVLSRFVSLKGAWDK